jgi:hypothetical protein
MLPAKTRYKLLFGPYRTPRFKFGATVKDEIRCKVTIVALTDARIPWPLGLKGKARGYIVYGALARAVRRESAHAVMYWWGVSRPSVRAWPPRAGRWTTERRNSGAMRPLCSDAGLSSRRCSGQG